ARSCAHRAFRQPPSIVSVVSSVHNSPRHLPPTTAEGTLHLGHTPFRRLLPQALEYSIPISGVGVPRLSTTGCISNASAHVLCLVPLSFLAPAHCRYSPNLMASGFAATGWLPIRSTMLALNAPFLEPGRNMDQQILNETPD